MTLRSLFLTAVVIFACWYWLKSREIKDVALRAAAGRCAELGLGLLDQSVVLKGLKWCRDNNGRLGMLRRYQFDFTSTGEERYQGEIVLHRHRVKSIKLAPHRVE